MVFTLPESIADRLRRLDAEATPWNPDSFSGQYVHFAAELRNALPAILRLIEAAEQRVAAWDARLKWHTPKDHVRLIALAKAADDELRAALAAIQTQAEASA